MSHCPRCSAECLTDPESGLGWCPRCGEHCGLELPRCRGLWWRTDRVTRAPVSERGH